MATNIKRLLIGRPFPTSADIHERLDKVRGLAIFASDPISSNAYATEAIMSVLVLISAGALRLTMPLALGIAALVFLVVFSYIQTILHYPDGGGAYTVTKDNLGEFPSLLAGSALLIDYILTVSVSVSAGIRAITSAFPETFDYRIAMALAAVAFLTWVNLRGVRESGTIFAFPTYAFVGGVLVVVVLGIARQFGLFGLSAATPIIHEVESQPAGLSQVLYIWLILRAFAAGCTALTGIEAISNGVQAFKPPESKNAARTMVAMGIIAMTLFLGITYTATSLNLVPVEHDSILSQIARAVTGGISGGGILYYWVQFFTMMILILAANTGYQDFPRLSSFLAHDGFLPRWLQNRGDRLVYNGGIITLGILASLIILIFRADEIAMLPLYALGVMLCFALSQSGMVRLMSRIGHLKPGESLQTAVTIIHYERNWQIKRAFNVVGAVVTAIVFLILMVTKFTEGAWVVVVAIPLLVWLFRSVKGHYRDVADALSTRDLEMQDLSEIANIVIVPIGDVHRGSLRALQYARKISNNVRALSVFTSPEMHERMERRWARFPEITGAVQLVCIDYDYRDVLTPIVDYIEYVNHVEFPDQIITVVIPEFIAERWPEQFLHNQTANILRFRLRHHEDIVVIDVPYHIRSNGSSHKLSREEQARIEYVFPEIVEQVKSATD
jgi:amino acid transporter